MPDDPPDPRDAELDGLKIRQISQLRRSAYRARSYALIGAFAGIVIVAQLIYLIVTQLRSAGFNRYIVAYALMIPLLIFGSIYCFGRAKQFLIEARMSKSSEASDPPDFTALSDGSQRWKDFDRIE
jgi:hypothetical protein